MLESIDEGRLEAITSSLTLAEILVKPFELDREDLARTYREVLTGSAHMRIVPVGVDIAVEAARIRADEHVRLADAIHLATSVHANADVFLTNDERLARCETVHAVLVSDLDPPQADDARDTPGAP